MITPGDIVSLDKPLTKWADLLYDPQLAYNKLIHSPAVGSANGANS